MLKRMLILGENEETIGDMVNTAGYKQNGPEFMSTSSKPSIPAYLWKVNGEEIPNLSSLSLKKIKKKIVDRVEKEIISYVLERNFWNRTKTAKVLDISYKTLLEKIKDLQINPPESDNQLF